MILNKQASSDLEVELLIQSMLANKHSKWTTTQKIQKLLAHTGLQSYPWHEQQVCMPT